ncbi:MAG: Fe-S cluster assembly protein SufD [Planctomycetota bacterium]|nr:Fe-S cluster assembly protein SufD [Planctomycetota bacterium]
MITTDLNEFDEKGFEEFIGSRNEPVWLIDQRKQAWQKFQDLSWPTTADEEWMRTDIRLFDLTKFAIPMTSTATTEENATEITKGQLGKGVELGGKSVTLNGLAHSSWLDDDLREKGVVFGNLSDLANPHAEIIRKFLFQKALRHDLDRFAALHAACWSSGTILYVPRNVTISKPLHIQSLLGEGKTDLGHTLVVLDEGAEATVLAESSSLTEMANGLHCGGIELIVGDRANLRFVNLQDWGRKVWHFAHQKAVVGRDANLQWTIGALGSRLAKVNQHVALDGVGANCQVNGVMFTEGKQHLSYHTLQHHLQPNCTSDFLYKGALQDTSRTVWRGMIKVDNRAQQTDGYQRNDNLLLSQASRADSIPGLEIEADDVRCTHGSTSGRVDEELIFYAQCRGYTRQEAIRMIVAGFFQQIFDRVTLENVRVALGEAIARRVRDYE